MISVPDGSSSLYGLVDIAIVMNNRFLTASPEMVVEVLYNEPVVLGVSRRVGIVNNFS
ncbi:MAG: hypothetical protein F6K47_16115 [Symploca sp. SIO2E6]|nr:hypothetical protein [Symploca sp. SIO2E6]